MSSRPPNTPLEIATEGVPGGKGEQHLPPMQASHQCGPSSIPGHGVKCGLSLLLVSSHPCSERFFSRYSGFPLSSKTNISKFQLTLKSPEIIQPFIKSHLRPYSMHPFKFSSKSAMLHLLY